MSRKEQIKDLFTFTKGERNGVSFLFVIILILISLYLVLKFAVKQEEYDFLRFEKELKEFEASLIPKTEQEYLNRLDKYIQERYDTLELFKFNPNTANNKQWKQLGLSDKQISTINNYLSKGGKFDDKEDFKRIYGLRYKQYQILKPYIQLPDRNKKSKTSGREIF